MLLNDNFKSLSKSYLFSEVASRIRDFKAQHTDADIIRMDIGDVTLPLDRCVAEAIAQAAMEQSCVSSFHGYGPEQGYGFLREAIAETDYNSRGIDISPDEIFISDGAKSDIANLTDIYGSQAIVALPDPVYPVYADSNEIAGRFTTNGKILYMPCTIDNGFKPTPPRDRVDVVYLCSPNNPTGTVLTRQELAAWIDYALDAKALIVFDSAYEAYITDPTLPKSIYELPDARKVAIEVRSYSKTAGFTGLRCGYTVFPRELTGYFSDGTAGNIHDLWLRRQTTKFNGASYVVQRGAAALYTAPAQQSLRENIAIYLNNAIILRDALRAAGHNVAGGENSPYVWIYPDYDAEVKKGDSWRLFERMLHECRISTTPGSGFGKCGEGCLRLTGFNTPENTLEAVLRIKKSTF